MTNAQVWNLVASLLSVVSQKVTNPLTQQVTALGAAEATAISTGQKSQSSGIIEAGVALLLQDLFPVTTTPTTPS